MARAAGKREGLMRSKHYRPSAKITANLEFSETGYLKAVYLNAETDSDQATLERALNRIMNPSHFSWIKRLREVALCRLKNEAERKKAA